MVQVSQLVSECSTAADAAESVGKQLQESEAAREALEAEIAELKRAAADSQTQIGRCDARISELQMVCRLLPSAYALLLSITSACGIAHRHACLMCK